MSTPSTSRTRRRRWLVAAGALAGSYLGLCLVARFYYPSLLFPAPRLAQPPPTRDGVTSIDIVHPGGEKTLALFVPPPEGGRVVVVFHGNGESVFDELYLAEWLHGQGMGAMLVEYRGYGVTQGPPSEKKIYEDAEASLRWLHERGIDRERITLWGYSLGSGVAVEMAKRGHGARIVLLAAYTSIVDVGKRFAPFLPIRLLLDDTFDTIDKCKDVRVPALVIHGERDELVPVAMGERVAAAIPGAELIVIKRGTHVDLLVDVPGHEPNHATLFARIATFLRR